MSIAPAALRVAKFAVRFAPMALAVVRILFAEGHTDVERSIQNGLRTVAQAVLRRFEPVTS
jgi:hypothetical protein